MGHCFSHLTKTDRYKLEAALLAGEKPQEIADRLHVHVSTIYREIKRARMVHRNSDWTEEERYNPDEAHRKYRRNLEKKGAGLKIGNDLQLADYLEKKVIDDGYSPAAALASIKLAGKKFSTSICVSTFYSYITKGVFRFLTNADLPEKPKKKREYKKVKTMKRPPRGESIEKRPAEVDTRETFGHWEGDTVYSKKDGSKALFVLTERLTREEIIVRIKDRTAESVIKALDRIERKCGPVLFRKIFRTITVDNGGEFSDVDRLERSALRKTLKRTKVYFCHPYSYSIVDLNATRDIVIIPLGGSVLKDWVNHNYLQKLGTPEFHIYDSDNTNAHAIECDRINRRGDGSSARVTQKREMENYIHSQVVQELFNIQIEIDDTMDVSTEISNIIRATNPEGFSPQTVKKKLNKIGAAKMTLELLQSRDPQGEVLGWLRQISEIVQ